jgi:hypothetical protein
VNPSTYLLESRAAFTAMALRDYFMSGSFHPRYGDLPKHVQKDAIQMKELFYNCSSIQHQTDYVGSLFATSIRMTPYLTPSELDTIWKGLERGSCVASFSEPLKQFVSLFKAVGSRDPHKMRAISKDLLKESGRMTPGTLKYLVASAMLGSIMQRDYATSSMLWDRYKGPMFANEEPDLLFQLLVAESRSH